MPERVAAITFGNERLFRLTGVLKLLLELNLFLARRPVTENQLPATVPSRGKGLKECNTSLGYLFHGK